MSNINTSLINHNPYRNTMPELDKSRSLVHSPINEMMNEAEYGITNKQEVLRVLIQLIIDGWDIIVDPATKSITIIIPSSTSSTGTHSPAPQPVNPRPNTPARDTSSTDRVSPSSTSPEASAVTGATSSTVQAIGEDALRLLPKEVRDSVSTVRFTTIDGRGKIQGMYQPDGGTRKVGYGGFNRDILIDVADAQINDPRYTKKVIAHESMHAFTFKMLNDIHNNTDKKNYDNDIDKLFNVYMRNVSRYDRASMPTAYSASYLDAIYSARSPEEQEQAIQVGFMEYIAELGAEYIGNGKAIPANAGRPGALKEGYEIMKGMMDKADNKTPVHSNPSATMASASQQQQLFYVA